VFEDTMITFNVPSPLSLDGWLDFNRIKWGVTAVRTQFRAGNSGLPSIEAVLYLNKAGRIYHPPRNPYMNVSFTPTATKSGCRVSRQWLEAAGLLVEETIDKGLATSMVLPPEIIDSRPWQWAGFRVGVKYTFYIDFPFTLDHAYNSIRTNVRKAVKAGYFCDKTTDMQDVYGCLKDTEVRKGFEHQLSLHDLELATELLGDEQLRSYVCYSPTGEPASSCVVLHTPGGRSLYWIAGTKTAHLASKATQLMINFVLEDLQSSGAVGVDLVVANIPSVAFMKANWGGRLMPYYVVDAYTLKHLAAWIQDWRRFPRLNKGSK